jgi:hypothetical protein
MKSIDSQVRLIVLIFLLGLCGGCGGSGGSNSSASSTSTAGSAATVTLVSLAVTPPNSSIAPGASVQFSATGSYSDGSTKDITSLVIWSATGSASISSSGLLTATSAGSVTVTATLGALAGSTTLTVSTATLVSIMILPASSTVAQGASLQYSATGHYSNGGVLDLTSQVTWNSSGAVLISSTGLASTSGAGAGTVSIGATSGAVSGATSLTVAAVPATAVNEMAITVNGSLCSSATSDGYLNKPCVSVTVCNPGSSTCQTINDVLLDTGSYGLRIFKSALSGLTLTQVASGSGSLAQCIQFADGSSLWGPVKLAGVQLGGEPAVQIPIQVIDSSFGGVPASCGTPDPDPATAGFTGILGVGPFAQDCGSSCVSSTRNGMYYRCVGSSCSGAAVSLANQVQNPVASLPLDNNGLLVQLPAATLGGKASLQGALLLGIGTRANNTPSASAVLATDQSGEFQAVFDGSTSTSFLDTGSNGLFFPGALTLCASPDSFWYCPSATTTLSATVGASGSSSAAISFFLGNFSRLSNSGNQVFSEIGGTSDFGFDWGLPFFLGRSVFFGMDATTSALGTGPYVAF